MGAEGNLSYSPADGVVHPLGPDDVETLDGFQTKYIAINGKTPGPTIEVPLGAEVSYTHVNIPGNHKTVYINLI